MLMQDITYKMAKLTKYLEFDDLTQDVIDLSKRFLIDSIGCAYGASQMEDVRIMSDFLNEQAGKEEATVFDSPQKLPMVNAGLLNSLMIRALDYNDIYWEQDPSHPSDLIPAALTPAEVLHKSGRDLIVAIVLAYEWEQRLCEFASPGLRETKWHHASLTQIASPLVTGKILGLSEEQLVHAVGICATHNYTIGAVTAGRLTMMKNTVDPLATQAGIFSALLAQRGYKGPTHVIDGKEGLTDTLVNNQFDLNILTDGWCESFRISRCSMKAFPTEALTHSSISAVIKIMKANNINRKDVKEVKIRTVARAADILSDPSKYDPRTRETADHSLPYCIATTIVDGSVTPGSFTEEKILDPEIRSYLNKIKVIADPDYEKTFPALKKAGVEITTENGNVYTIEIDYPLGDYREPMDDDMLFAKFDSMVLPIMGQDRRNKIVDTIFHLEKLKDVADFTKLLG
jgi:2-methylcitrate dehydratase